MTNRQSSVKDHPGSNGIEDYAADALQQLLDEIDIWRRILDRLEAGHALNRAEGIAALGSLLESSQHLRDVVLSANGSVAWETKADLEKLVKHIDQLDARRSKYERLARIFESGTVIHRREVIKAERLKLRDEAVLELRQICSLPFPPELVGPNEDEWLVWAWALVDGSEDLVRLQKDDICILVRHGSVEETCVWRISTV